MSGDSFDAVVIGSGLGGLTAAALSAKAGRRVCVIERNNSVGGCASVFKKGALIIEPALHQTADPRDPSEPKHGILKELGLLDEIEWVPVSPIFSVRGGPVGDVYDLPVGFDAAREAMARRFPGSRKGIDRLFDLLETVQAGVADLSRARAEPPWASCCAASWSCAHWSATGAPPLMTCWHARSATTRRQSSLSLAISVITPTIRAACGGRFFALAQGGFLRAGGVFIKADSE